jgi:predicted  nucleic acid-binding Zn-ribbon protein
MQHETAALKRYLGVLEDRQLEVMIQVEELEAAQAAAIAALDAVQAQAIQKNSRLIAERSSLATDSNRLESERGPTVGSIPPEDLALYEQLRKQRRGVAVAKVTDSACSACGSILNSALLHVARSPSQIVRCDLCGRILYGG